MARRCFVCNEPRVPVGTTVNGRTICIQCWNDVEDERRAIRDLWTELGLRPPGTWTRELPRLPGQDAVADTLGERRRGA